MALFDLNSRYTKSMEHGGSYERDASIGGYNRKELRGLNKQARRGSLTQRERARLKYLTDERRGRRKRGLLSGLGGAAATLGALAAAGKLGEGKGGAALMDAIKSRLAGAQEKGRERYVSRSNKQKVIEDAKRDQKALMNEAFDLESGYPSSKDDPLLSRIARRPRGLEDIDLPEEEFSDDPISIKESLLARLKKSPGATTVESGPAQPSDLELMSDYGLLPEGSRKVSQDASRTQEVSKLRDFLNKKSTPLSDDQVRKLRSEGEAHTQSVVDELRKKNALDEAFEEMRIQEAQRSAPMVEDFKQVGNEPRGTDPRTDEEREKERDELMKYLNFKGRLKQDPDLQKLLRSYFPYNKGGKIDEGSVKDLLSRLSKTESYDIDPENMTTGNIPPEKFLNEINKARLEKGLPEVDRISNQAINDILNMKPLKPKQPSDIFNRYSNI